MPIYHLSNYGTSSMTAARVTDLWSKAHNVMTIAAKLLRKCVRSQWHSGLDGIILIITFSMRIKKKKLEYHKIQLHMAEIPIFDNTIYISLS